MSQVMEVSEGIPVEGRRFETPPISLDHQKPRYVTFLGNLIDREAASNKPWTKGGGIQISNPCLKYVKNFLRKGRITPVLKDTHDYRPLDLQKRASEGDTSYFPQAIPPGYVAPHLPEGGPPAKHGYMMGKIVLPGEQIGAIVEGSAAIAHGGMRRGVVEIRALKGQDYVDVDFEFNGVMIHTDRTVWEIQRAIFPDYPFVPPLIEDVGRLIQAAKQHTEIRDVVDDYENGWEQFREYASVTIRHTHQSMREIAGASHGYVPTYTATDLILLEQLGLARQDEEIRRQSATPTSDPELREMFKAWMQSNIEEKELLRQQAARALAVTARELGIDQDTMAAAPIDQGQDGYPGQSGYSGYSGDVMASQNSGENITEPITDDLAERTCECEKVFGSVAGKVAHQRQWCPLRQKTEE